MPGADVRDVQVFADLHRALSAFATAAQEAIAEVERDVRQTLEWLQERELYWRRQVDRGQAEVDAARAALHRCQKQDERHRDCSDEESALRVARHRHQQAEEELANTRRWKARVEEAVRAYELQAKRFREASTVRTDEAKAFLERRREEVTAYAETRLLAPSHVDRGSRGDYTPRSSALVLGDPAGLANSWRFQGDNNSCAVHAQGGILQQFGVPFDKQQYVAESTEAGWMDESGTFPSALGELLVSHGVSIDRKSHATLADLQQALMDGRGVVVAVNTEPLWGVNRGHALWVTGLEVDRQTKEIVGVVCNDSGHPGGAAISYDADAFLLGWSIYANDMVTTRERMPVKMEKAA